MVGKMLSRAAGTSVGDAGTRCYGKHRTRSGLKVERLEAAVVYPPDMGKRCVQGFPGGLVDAAMDRRARS
jgi:hypothetical protein